MTCRSVLPALIFLAACNQTRQAAPPDKKPSPQYFKVDAASAGTVRGHVRFDGKPPAAKRISMDTEEACEALHKTAVYDEALSPANDGSLPNTFVYVKRGLEGKVFPPAAAAAVLDQRGCQFVPRVVALRTGQTLTVKNSDPVSHNIHPMPKENRDWNQQQPPDSPDLHRRFARPEVMIPVKCNVHGWMRTYIAVLEHPYFAVTGRNGDFKFDPLPPGKYTIAAWHESLGEITQEITVLPKAEADVKFAFR